MFPAFATTRSAAVETERLLQSNSTSICGCHSIGVKIIFLFLLVLGCPSNGDTLLFRLSRSSCSVAVGGSIPGGAAFAQLTLTCSLVCGLLNFQLLNFQLLNLFRLRHPLQKSPSTTQSENPPAKSVNNIDPNKAGSGCICIQNQVLG